MDRPLQSPRTTASVLFTGLAAAVIVIAAGCGSPAVTPAVPDPCTAVPAADVARITHLAAAAAITLHQQSHNSAICEYGAADNGNGVLLRVQRFSRAMFDAGLQDARSRGARCTELSIGEAAYACWASSNYGALNVYVHGVIISVEVNRSGPDQPAETRALARFAASRY